MKNNYSPNDNLTEEKQQLLKLLLKKKGINLEQCTTIGDTIARRAEGANAELSFAQKRLWVLDKLEGGNIAYNIPSALFLKGVLDISVLEQVLAEIVRRHSILRTSFPIVEGNPVQAIAVAQTITISTVDLRSLAESQQPNQVQRLADIEAQQPFDLATGPLLRVQLLVLAETSHVLLVTMHHIISDGWSVSIFINEVAALYEAFYESKPSPLPELTIQYADFAAWQRQWLSGQVLETQLNYWRNQLQGIPPLLELPSDRPRPAVQTFSGSTQSFELDIQLTQKLEYLSQNSGTTLFMTLLAAFVVLLACYSGQQDIVIGSPIANRNRQEIEQLIGFFVNTLVLRSAVDDNPTFNQLLQRVKQTALDAYAHQDLPFEQLVEALQPERSLSYSPLFQVMFVLQNAPSKQLELPGLTLTAIATTRRESKFDLTLAIEQTPTGLIGEWEYNTDLFDATTIQRLTEHFQTLLSGIVVNPEQTVFQLPLLTPSQLQHILVESNQTYTQYSDAECLHRLFEKQVELTPDAVAVVFEDESLTYRQLNQRANQLAHYLQFFGVKPDVLVGICVERSLLMIIGLLAILKAGGAYVPFDPNYPQQRLAFMFEDTQVPVLLTQQRLLENLPKNTSHLICLDTESEINSQSQENIVSQVQPENLVYVIYTSGSTGTPKGVMNTHAGLYNRLTWMQETYQLTSEDCVVLKTPFSFDVSVWEIFWTLLTGCRLVVSRPDGHKDTAYLVELIIQQQVTTLHFVPSMLQVFLEEQKLENCSCLKRLFCSGEALPFELQERFFARLNCQLHNLYGPTEASIDVSYWQCKPNSSLRKVPIGRPIANTQLYILDSYLQPVPIGVIGELHIGGAGLAKGYLNRPELTAEKFIINPFKDFIFECLSNSLTNSLNNNQTKWLDYFYKTGDLVRYLSDGNIEYIGRIDNQVKLRGFRIELGEIEAVLTQHHQVRESVVVAREDKPGNKRLVAYIVSYSELISTSELRDFLKEKLPEYMLPSAFVMLTELPLTANGKLNYHALPIPDAPSKSSVNFVLPCTPVEKIIANTWATVLGLEEVGIYNNFFELGGDSIKVIQVVSRLAQHNLKLKEKQIFQFPTIAELTEKVVFINHQANQDIISGVVPLTPIQSWFLSTYVGCKNHFNQSLMLANSKRWNVEVLHRVIQQIQTHHDALRLRFKNINGRVVQEYGGTEHPLSFEIINLVELDSISQLETIVNQVQASMNYEQEPLIRFVLFQLEQSDRLLIVAHHLIIDALSWRILLEDLSKGYEQASYGNEIKFPVKTDSYQQWATTLQKYSEQLLDEEQEYWLKLVNTTHDKLKVDFPDTNNIVRDNLTLSFSLTIQQTNLILTEVHHPYNTKINDILLTGLAKALNSWCGGQRFLIDLEGHGRVDDIDGIDVTRTIGWFTTIYPALIEIDVASNIGYQIKSIKEMLRRIPHQGIGYGILRYLKNQNQQDFLIQDPNIIFNYLGRIDEDITNNTFELAQESCGELINPQSKRLHELEFSGLVYDGKMRISITFCAARFQKQNIQLLLDCYQQALIAIIEHCKQQTNIELTPSDLTYSDLSLSELDEILALE